MFWAETVALMNATRAVAGWASMLKSGEISATCFYERPYFVDDD
jgi:hypothetical protein